MQSRFQPEHKLDTRTASAMSNMTDELNNAVLDLLRDLRSCADLRLWKRDGAFDRNVEPGKMVVTMNEADGVKELQARTTRLSRQLEEPLEVENWDSATMCTCRTEPNLVGKYHKLNDLPEILDGIKQALDGCNEELAVDDYNRLRMFMRVVTHWIADKFQFIAGPNEEAQDFTRVLHIFVEAVKFGCFLEQHEKDSGELIDAVVAAAEEELVAAAAASPRQAAQEATLPGHESDDASLEDMSDCLTPSQAPTRRHIHTSTARRQLTFPEITWLDAVNRKVGTPNTAVLSPTLEHGSSNSVVTEVEIEEVIERPTPLPGWAFNDSSWLAIGTLIFILILVALVLFGVGRLSECPATECPAVDCSVWKSHIKQCDEHTRSLRATLTTLEGTISDICWKIDRQDLQEYCSSVSPETPRHQEL